MNNCVFSTNPANILLRFIPFPYTYLKKYPFPIFLWQRKRNRNDKICKFVGRINLIHIKIMKKHLLLFFIMALLPLVASAYQAYINGIYYNFLGNEATVTSTGPESDSYSGTVVVPEFVNYKSKTFRVTDIDGIAFFYCSNLTSVTIPGSVKCIGNNVFAHCYNLTYVTISNGVTSIGDYAFRDCNSLTSITIPNSVTSIGEGAFSRCNGLTSITIPNSVTSIGNEAFEYCENLISISIPENMTSIGDYAFNGTAWYQNFYDNHPDGILYLGKVALGYKGTMTEGTHITIKEGTTKIAGHAFTFYNNLTSITIPNSVTSIGESAFSYCSNLSSITIPNSVTNIGMNAFSNTTWYNNQPDGLVYVGKVAYKYKGTMPEGTQIVIKDGTTEISGSAFNYCKGLTSVSIPNSVTNVGDMSFADCNALTSVTIPNSVTSIGNSAFSGCSGLTSVTIPNSVTSIGSGAFYGCSGLTAVFINDLSAWCKIPFIYEASNPLFYAHHLYLKGQKVKNLVIPDGITNIGNYAFSGCTGITSVTIPNSVSNISNYAFSGCTGLTSVTIPNSVTSIGNYTFRECSNLTSVSIPNGVTYIGEGAFYKCSGLISVTIPESVLGINRGTFNDCSSLTSITIPECLTKIYNYAFEGTAWYNNQPDGVLYIGKVLYGYKGNMPSGTQITIKEGTLGIADYAFGNYFYNSLYSITIPNSVISIGDEAFYNCRALTSITIPESVLEIGSAAFQWCNNLTSINIPESVTSIKNKTFQGCNNITSVTIPRNVSNIDYAAFQGCKCLASVTSHIQNPFSTGSLAFESIPSDATLYVPAGTKSKYQDLADWNRFTNIQEVSDPIFNDGDVFTAPTAEGVEMTFKVISASGKTCQVGEGKTNTPCINKATTGIITIPQTVKGFTVTTIGGYAFTGCTNLTSITIPENVKSIGYQAFYNCSSLATITIPKSVTSLDDGVFYKCSGLTSVNIMGNVPSLGWCAFGLCSSLTSFTIPASVTNIGEYAFYNCSKLKSVTSKIKKPFATGFLAFNGIPNDAILYVPIGTESLYRALSDWNQFNIIVEKEDDEMDTDDLQDYLNSLEDTEDTMAGGNYRREFRNTDWQSLYLPFSIEYADWAEGFEVARFDGIDMTSDGNDAITQTVLSATIMDSGKTRANTPYLIRAKNEGTSVLSVNYSSTNYAVNSVSYSTDDATYTFTGNYTDMADMFSAQRYRMQGGWLNIPTSDSEVLRPYRWYMTKTLDDSVPSFDTRSLKIRIHSEDNATVVNEIINRQSLNSECYDLQGRKVTEAQIRKGIYIINNKKYFFK